MPHTITLRNGPLSFTTLSNFDSAGVFERSGRKWTRVVILLHGFPDEHHTFSGVWDKLESELSDKTPTSTDGESSVSRKSGSSVLLLAPKLRGYERSSQPDTFAYSLEDLAGDVRAWIISLNASKVPVHILGHDWGAVVGYKSASLYPDLISSLATLAIPYTFGIKPWNLIGAAPNQLWLSSYMLRMQFSALYSSALQQTGSDSYLDKLWKFWSPTWNYTPEDIAGIKELLQDESLRHSTTAYYRAAFNIWNIKQLRLPINFEKVPTLVIGGEVDGCMSQGLFQAGKEHHKNNPNVRIEIVPGTGHFLQRENPEEISRLAVDWFKAHAVGK